MGKDEKVIIKTSQFSRELLEQMFLSIEKNKAAAAAKGKKKGA